MAILDRGAPTPLYHQVKTLLLRDIESGRFRAGEQLPTEDALSTQFQVSKITIRQALRELSSLGYVRREQGRGTFVQRPPVEQGPRELTSFSDEMRRHGMVASSRILERGPIAASAELASELGLNPGDEVFRLRRLRLADGEPMGVQTTFLALPLVPGIDAEPFGATSLYEVLRTRYGLNPNRARETHRAVAIAPDVAALLRVPAGSPGMAAERVAYLADGRPLEYVESIMRGDRYKVVLELSRPSIPSR
jgi:GntR family transcriptional regulator